MLSFGSLAKNRFLSPSASTLIGIQFLLKILSVDCQNVYPNPVEFENFPKSSGYGTGLIAGGVEALPGEFDFMAALGWFDESGKLSFHAGGMMIGDKMVLTAAHCVYKDGKVPDVVYVGGTSLKPENLSKDDIVRYLVVSVTVHPEYDPNQGYHDIAIIELDRRYLSLPVCILDTSNPDLVIKDVTAIGYGLTEFAGKGSFDLLKVNLTVFDPDFCKPFFERQRKFKMGLSDAHICAGDKEGIKDTCQGDSGGPLLVIHGHERYAVGITSSGQACSGFPPAVYTKIYPYIDWIRNVLKERGEVLPACELHHSVNGFSEMYSRIREEHDFADYL